MIDIHRARPRLTQPSPADSERARIHKKDPQVR